jgi:oxygen-independent coproporphyrinogen III oxidase
MRLDISMPGETLNVTPEILDKYNVPGPRYTSYPTAPEWDDSFGSSKLEEALRLTNSAKPARPLSIYMHLPFCERLCLFCGCNVVISKNHEVALPYLQALKWEVDQMARRLNPDRPVVQFHWGGGTPTYLSSGQMEELFLYAKERFTFAPDAEIGCEVDPRVTTDNHLTTLRRLGFNRISMGVQDFNPIVQKTVRRIQPFEQTRVLFDRCRNLRFDSVNIDLIYGLPHQTPDSFVESVEKLISLHPDRIAMFSYAHVPWLKKQQGSFSQHLPLGMDKFQIFQAGIERFTAAGYVYIGMDHFALPDDELCSAQRERTLHRNFQGYTTKAGADLIGMGVSSISGLDDAYAQNYRDLESYYSSIQDKRLPTMRGVQLKEDDRVRRTVISRLLCHCVLYKKEVEAEFGLQFDEYFESELNRLKSMESDGIVRLSDDVIAVTSLGRIFMRNVGMVFDKYLLKPKDRPVFSKTL